MNKLGHIFVGLIAGALIVLVLMAKLNDNVRRESQLLSEKNDSLLRALTFEEELRDSIELKNANLRRKIEEVQNKEAQIINEYEKEINNLKSNGIDAFNARMDSVSRFITDYYESR